MAVRDPNEDGIKVVVVGDGAVGKTCLLTVFKDGVFPDKYIPTVFDNYQAMITVDDKTYPVMLWDTAGQEGFAKLRPLAYGESDAFILCFAITSSTSLHHCMQVWLPELVQYCPNAQVILTATKCDLADDPEHVDNVVPDFEAEEMVQQMKLGAYIKCSAKNGVNVNEVFQEAVRLHLQWLANQGGSCCEVM